MDEGRSFFTHSLLGREVPIFRSVSIHTDSRAFFFLHTCHVVELKMCFRPHDINQKVFLLHMLH